jgi:hypothetical protein
LARDTIFICHATLDDNNFVRWLGARLTAHGYKVWADMFSLKGGMPFWNTIEDALREHACKVVYVASKASVDAKRRGVRNELSVADAVRKALRDPAFIIPVRLDDAFSDFPILVHQLNAIDFIPALSFGPLALAIGAARGLSLHAVGVTKHRFSRSLRKPGRNFAPPTCRMPLGQYQASPRADPGGRVTPQF